MNRLRLLDLFSGIGAFSLGLERSGLCRTVGFVEIEPHAQAVLRRHWPDVPIHDDILTREFYEGEADVICGGFPCFPAGTLILTQRGLIDIADIAVGDEVWTHRNRWRPVAKYHGSHLAPTVKLRGQGHPEMVTTANHPFWASTKTRQSTHRSGKPVCITTTSDPDWVNASEMHMRFWASPTVVSGCCIPDWPSKVIDKEAFFWCLGRWLADGWVVTYRRTSKIPAGKRGSRVNSVASRVHWCASYPEADELEAKLLAAGIETCRVDDRTAVKFIVQSRELADFLAPFGKMAHGKTVPTWLLSAPVSLKEQFLEGYRTGDGSAHSNGWKATTVSKAVAIGIRLLAISLGWSVSLHLTKRSSTCVIEGRKVSQRNSWQLVAEKTARSSFTTDSGHRFGLVRSVSETGRTEEVFNFEVEEDNSYVADGIVVKNCQDVSCAGKRAGLAGERSGLYRELVRAIRVVRPEIALVENVAMLLSDGMGTVLGDLAESGGSLEWDCVPASSVGAPHERDRVFIIAHRDELWPM